MLDGDRVQVDDAEERVALLLRLRVLAKAAAVVPDVRLARRLDSREDPHPGILPGPAGRRGDHGPSRLTLDGGHRLSRASRVSARRARAHSRLDRRRGAWTEDRRRLLRADRGPVHGRDQGADARDGPRGRGGGRDRASRRRVQAAHVAVRVPGPRSARGSRSSRRRGRRRVCRSSPSSSTRATSKRSRRRRRDPDRRPEHAELQPARRGRPGPEPGPAEARAVGDGRGAAHGGRVRREGRERARASCASAASRRSSARRASRSTSPRCRC